MSGVDRAALPTSECLPRSPGGALELVVLVGLPGSGKSTFARRFAATHRLISLDVLRGRRQPAATQLRLVDEALAAGYSVVVDNVHAAPAARAPLIALGHARAARVVAYFLDAPKAVCLARNRQRTGRARVPDVAIHIAAARLVPPAPEEGFDEVRHVDAGGPGPPS
jgi:predicted kinase